MKISVIIPAFNSAKTIGACVDAVLHQQRGEWDLEVVVVDDGSNDATAEIVKTFERALYVYQPNAGPAAARNTGTRHASGEILVFTDSDCVAQRDWLLRLIGHFENPAVHVVAGSYGIFNPERLLTRCIYREILYRHEHLLGDWVAVFGSYNVAIRRGLFEKSGGFDESYRRASGEDNDLSYRLNRQGIRIRFEKEAKVDHVHPVSLRRYLFEQYRHGFWRAKMYRDYPQRMKGDGYTFWKDMIEVPLSVIIVALVLSAAAGYGGLAWAWILLLWWLGETIFGGIFHVGNVLAAMYFGLVMVLRSWFRTAGFAKGLFLVKSV